MKVLVLLTVLVLSVGVCSARTPFSTSECQEVKSPVCTADTTISFYPHETDCSLFYICNSGRISTHACPEGEYFYDKSDLCMPSRYVICNRCASNRARCGDSCGCGESTTPPPYEPTTERVTPGVPTTERVTPAVPTTERV